LKLFEQITFLEEYYLTNAEIEVLESFANNIVERTVEGTRLVEFGSGYALCPAVYSHLFCLPHLHSHISMPSSNITLRKSSGDLPSTHPYLVSKGHG
jgi:uncharacterized SAM-dependent methyltransferase